MHVLLFLVDYVTAKCFISLRGLVCLVLGCPVAQETLHSIILHQSCNLRITLCQVSSTRRQLLTLALNLTLIERPSLMINNLTTEIRLLTLIKLTVLIRCTLIKHYCLIRLGLIEPTTFLQLLKRVVSREINRTRGALVLGFA